MNTGTYDPTKVIITIDSHTIVNYADGTFVECSRKSDNYEAHVGADGQVTRTKNADPTGEVKITLSHNSPSNQKLMALAKSGAVVPFGITDQNFDSSVGVSGAEAWIQKQAGFKRGKGIEDVEWTICVADYEQSHDDDGPGGTSLTS